MFAIVNGEEIPEYYGKPYIEICNNIPNFKGFPKDKEYKKLGSYVRCEKEYKIYLAYTCLKWTFPSKNKSRFKMKEGISKYYPDSYNFIKGDGYLFNYCHLIGHQLLKEKSNEKNLIVGTRYMNERGMSPFEDQIKNCLNNKNQVNHVLYRVTPIYNNGDQLVKGVQMEALSVEDYGKEICFNVFAYNVQPGVAINYEHGISEEDKKWCNKIFSQNKYTEKEKGTRDYILNTGIHIFHNSNCEFIDKINDENKKVFKYSRQFLIDNGYKPCNNCNP